MAVLNSKGIYINDSLHGLIRLSEFEKDIVSSIGFNRLHDISKFDCIFNIPIKSNKAF